MDFDDDEPSASFDDANPCPHCGAWPLAPGDGSGRVCVECGWSWSLGREGGAFVPEQVRVGPGWRQYAGAIIEAMAELLEDVDERHRELVLEAGSYWLAIGLVLGLERREAAERLLGAIEPQTEERSELRRDADDFISAAV